MNEDEKLNLDDIVDLIPIDSNSKKLAQEILDEQDVDKVQDLTHLFNLNQAKKNVLRVMKLNNLLDKVSDQMIERFEKHPGEFSNNDLLNYMTVTQNAIDRAQKQLNLVDETPAISLTQVNVNVEESKLDRNSRAKITEAVSKILQAAQKMNINLDEEKQDTILIGQDDIISDDGTTINKSNIENYSQDISVSNTTKLLNEEEY